MYEKGSEAQVVRTLADPSIVDVEILQRGWTVDHLLRTLVVADISSCAAYAFIAQVGSVTGESLRLLLSRAAF